MKIFTLIYIIDFSNEKICLGMKKRGLGEKRWNGAGGKFDKKIDFDIKSSALRELEEEFGVSFSPNDLEYSAYVDFIFADQQGSHCYLYIVDTQKDLVHVRQTEEMKPRWFGFESIPYDHMWPVDRSLLEKILKKEKFRAIVYYKDQNQLDHIKYLPFSKWIR